MNTDRAEHTASLLTNGTVLIAGGYSTNSSDTLASVEVYDPVAGTFSVTGSMNTTRQDFTTTVLNNGQPLIAGGVDVYSNVLNSSELYQPAQPLPSGWLDQDVGSVGASGSATYSSGMFTVNGAGIGTKGVSSDAFNFVYQPLSGDGTIVARVVSMPPGTQAGLMIRNTLDAGALNGNITENEYSTTSAAVNYYARTTVGGSDSWVGSLNNTGVSPYWLEMVRSGNTINSYGSPDGANWTQVGTSQTITMATNVYVGLVVSSDNPPSLATSTFDSVSVAFPGQTSGPSITEVTPTVAIPGASVTLSGANFGSTQGASTVTFNGVAGTPTNWTSNRSGATPIAVAGNVIKPTMIATVI